MEDSKRKMIKYLKLLQFFRETTESDYYMPMKPVFLGLSFTAVDAVVAFSDCYLNAHIYRVFRRDKTFLDKLVDVVQSLQNYPKDIHNLMDDLCKKGNFNNLKYTCWKDGIGSKLQHILVSHGRTTRPQSSCSLQLGRF
ncbi:hypothetical protein Ddye_012474 [Dipteronia dyeriana]|uniref:Uncharacterized protein n=1 Tax=Dipteronia dyeriana TaxID=168575 RepID=A0AAE0CJA1_9ROSI|nr:hypothetical protein Ddye_012474 [Dipteronia dyeriana]